MEEQAKGYIRAGDIFQVVLSQRFESPFALPPFALYRALRRINPAPFLVYLNFDGFSVVCSSPEILVRLRRNKVTIRPSPAPAAVAQPHRRTTPWRRNCWPIPGARRAPDAAGPRPQRCWPGVADRSVKVTDSFFIERYSQVMHIVSNVEGELDPRFDALDVLAAGFPAGTGLRYAAKVRAMEIIDELERDKRGIYAGAIGYFGANGEMDTCIVLRTAVVKDGRMYVPGRRRLVYDSVPESEHQECINKAKALFRAGEKRWRFAARAWARPMNRLSQLARQGRWRGA